MCHIELLTTVSNISLRYSLYLKPQYVLKGGDINEQTKASTT